MVIDDGRRSTWAARRGMLAAVPAGGAVVLYRAVLCGSGVCLGGVAAREAPCVLNPESAVPTGVREVRGERPGILRGGVGGGLNPSWPSCWWATNRLGRLNLRT